MPLRVLLTGHNGYIGSALAPLLQACGHVVVGLDAGYFRECTLGNAAQDPPCLWKDVRDVDADTLRRFDAVIHLAAVVPRLGHGVTDGAVESINRKSALRLAKLAKRAGAARFIMASSSLEARETDAWPEPDVNTECGITALADDSFAPLVLRLPEVYGASPR